MKRGTGNPNTEADLRALADKIRGLHREVPPDDLAPGIIASLQGLPAPSVPWPRRLFWRLDGPFAAWGYRLAVLVVLAGIMAGIWTLVVQRRPTLPAGPGQAAAEKVRAVSPATAEHRVSVAFVFYAPKAHNVVLVGTFNDWNPRKTPMVKGRNGIWTVKLNLTSGRYEYLFLVDGTHYETDPNAVEVRPDGLGHENAVLRL